MLYLVVKPTIFSWLRGMCCAACALWAVPAAPMWSKNGFGNIAKIVTKLNEINPLPSTLSHFATASQLPVPCPCVQP